MPYDGFSTLSDEAVRLNLRLRLNVGMERHNLPHLVDGQCKCINSRDNNQTKVTHNYTCLLSSKVRNARHYAIRNVLYKAARKGMMAPQLEPTDMHLNVGWWHQFRRRHPLSQSRGN